MRTRIKELRARYNLTQEDLAKKVGVRREIILFIFSFEFNESIESLSYSPFSNSK
jgi:putative transcriptional regulator